MKSGFLSAKRFNWQHAAFLTLKLLALLALLSLPYQIFLNNHSAETGLLDTLYLGEKRQAKALPELKADPAVRALSLTPEGYDGQFYAQIALRPLSLDEELDEALDLPAYRLRRIGMPLFAYALGFGQPAWILQAYAAINFLVWAALLLLLLRKYPPRQPRHILLAFGLLGGTGTLVCLDRALTDFPAAALGVTAILLTTRWWLRALLLAASGLIKDTSLLSAGAAAPGLPWPFKHALRQLGAGLIIVMPALCWMFYVSTHYGTEQATGFGNFALPLQGLADKLGRSTALLFQTTHDFTFALFEWLCPLSLIVQALYLAMRPRPSCPFWAFGAGFALLLAFLGNAVWAEQLAYARVLLPLTFAFNFCILQERSHRSYALWWLAGNAGMGLYLYRILA